MLVLTRRPNESIIIANNITITVVSVGPGRVKLGIQAPPNVRVDRKEIHDKIEQSSDVLAAVASANSASESPNTVVAPDTALIVSTASPEAVTTSVPKGTPQPAGDKPAGEAPPLPVNTISKFRPRKPR